MANPINNPQRASSLGAAALLAVLFAASPSFAQLPEDQVKADVPFAFMAGSKTLPAGMYEFTIDVLAKTVAIHGPKNANATELILTTLAAPTHSTADHTDLVFDKVGDTLTLSELWVTGHEGVLVHATKENHEHRVLHLKK